VLPKEIQIRREFLRQQQTRTFKACQPAMPRFCRGKPVWGEKSRRQMSLGLSRTAGSALRNLCQWTCSRSLARPWQIPFAAPQSAQVASKRFFAASRLCVKLFAWFAVNLRARPPARTGMGEGRSDFYALDNRWPGFRVVNESSPRRTPRSRLAWMVLKMLVGLTNK
jgi:hypothetical protein